MKKETIKITIYLILILLSINSFSQNSENIHVFKNVNLVPMTEDTVIANQTVITQGSKIIHIGKTNTLEIPLNANIIDGTGKYLMPGLADMHAHYLYLDRSSFFNLFLKNGVTTVRLMPGVLSDIIPIWKEKINNKELLGPSLFNCGPWFNSSSPSPEILNTEERDYDFIKIYDRLTKKEFSKIMEVAQNRNIYTIGHIPFFVGLDKFIKEGMNEVAHISELDYELVRSIKLKPMRNIMFAWVISRWLKDIYSYNNMEEYLSSIDNKMNKTVAKVKESGMFVHTTLIIDKLVNESLFEKEKFLKRPEIIYAHPVFMANYLRGEDNFQLTLKGLKRRYKKELKGDDGSLFLNTRAKVNKIFIKKLHAAKVPLLLGTDCSAESVAIAPGYSVHEELQMLTECGLTPFEAIKTGTVNAGIAMKAMTGTNGIGTIEINKKADFILTTRNPLEDITNIKAIDGVMTQGIWLPKEQLNTMQIIVKKDLAVALLEMLGNKLNKKAIEIIKDSLDNYSINEGSIISLGYQLLRNNKTDEAIEVFKINVQAFPDSWNAYDSLGDAYSKKGDFELAIKNYEKSIEVDPINAVAHKKLKKLKKKT